MIRLLVVTNLFHPDCAGGAALFSDLCRELSARGVHVTVQCAYPYYPEWNDKSGRNGVRILAREESGLKIERHGLYIPKDPNSLLQRLIYEGSFFLSLLRSLPKGKMDFDAIMVFCPLEGAVAYAVLRGLLHGTPVWLNIQDLSAEAAEAAGISNSGLVNRFFRRLQGFLFNRADVWSTISPEMAEKARGMAKRNQPVLFLPNWVNASLAEKIDALPAKAGKVSCSRVKLLYSGNIGKKQDLLRFCKALHRSDASFEFRIQGDGGECGALRRWMAKSGDERFSYSPFLDESGFVRALRDADLYVITEKEGSGGSFIQSKLIPGIRSGTPVLSICDADGPLGSEMEKIKPGPRFCWSQLPQVADFVENLPGNPDYPVWRKNALAGSAFYDRDRIVTRFEEILSDIVQRKAK